MTFPIKVRMRAQALAELEACEYGSYEDHIAEPGTKHHSAGGVGLGRCSLDGSRMDDYAEGQLHIVEIIQRGGKTVVTLNDQAELDTFFSSAMSGTWGMYHLGVAERVYKELEPYVSPDVSKRWPIGLLGY